MTHIKSRRTLALCLCCWLVISIYPKTFGAEKKGAERWLAALHDQNVRLDVAYDFRLLEPISKETVGSLVGALKDKDPFVRRHVAGALGEIGREPEMIVPALINSLRDRDSSVREQAVIALSKLGTSSVPSLIKLLYESDARLRPGRLKKRKDSLLKSLLGDDVPLSDYAALALERIGAPAFPELISALKKNPTSSSELPHPCKGTFIFPSVGDIRSIDRADRDNLPDYSYYFDIVDLSDYSDRLDYEDCHSSEQRYARYLLSRISLPVDSAADLIQHSADRVTRLWAVVALRNNGEEAGVAVPALTRALYEDDPELNLLAVEVLGKYGGKAIPALLSATKNRDAAVRISALRRLVRLRSEAEAVLPDVVAGLVIALQESDEHTRISALSLLQVLGTEAKDATPAIVKALKDSSPRVRSEAASTLGPVGREDSTALAALTDALSDDAVSTEAASSLGWFGPAARVALPELLKLRRRVAKDSALSVDIITSEISSIGRDDPSTISALIKDLSDPDPNIAASAAENLGNVGGDDPAVVTALITALNSEHPDVRENAAKELGYIGPGAIRAIPALVAALKKDKQNLHRVVPDALGNMGTEAIPALLEILGSSDSEIRGQVLSTLQEMKTNEPRLVSVLIETLKDGESDVRRDAVSMLGDLGMGAKEAIPTLLPLLKDPDKHVRLAVIDALDKLGAEANIEINDILVLLNDKEQTLRIAAAMGLLERGVYKEQATQVILKESLEVDDSERSDYYGSRRSDYYRWFALSNPRLIPVILDSLRSGSAQARTGAALWLAHNAPLPAESMPVLISALGDKNLRVRRWIITAISRSGADSKTAGAALVKALRDKDVDVKMAAAEALFEMGYDPSETGLSLNTAIYDRYIHQFLKEALETIRKEMRPPNAAYLAIGFFLEEREVAPRLKWWPPPRFSDWYVLPRERIGTDRQTLADVYKRISGALSEKDYQGQAIYEVPDGFALVTKVERIHEDGSAYPAPERWTNVKLSPKSLSEYMGSLWLGPPGHFRLFMFVVTTRNDLQGSNEQLSEEDARGLFALGGRVLSHDIGDKSFGNHQCHVVVYHFEKKNGVTKVDYDDPLDAITHLKQSGLWRQLNLE